MPDKNDVINIVKPDGGVISGTREQLSRLQLLGDYREETEHQSKFRESEAATERMYSTTGDKLKTFGTGLVSGATLGLADPLIDTEEEKLRAKYNPNARLAGEIVGGVAPALVPGGEFTPAGLLSRGATGAAKAVGGGFKGAAVAGAIEGAGAGVQAEISNATLSDDPLTAQSLLSGIGYGALFGAGLNAGIHGLGQGAERLGKKLEAKPPEPVYAPKSKSLGEIEVVNQDNYNEFRKNILDTRDGAISNPAFVEHTQNIKRLEDELAQIDSRYRLDTNAGPIDQADVVAFMDKQKELNALKAKTPPAETITPHEAVDSYISKVDDDISGILGQHDELVKSIDQEAQALKDRTIKYTRDAEDMSTQLSQQAKELKSKIPGAEEEFKAARNYAKTEYEMAQAKLRNLQKSAEQDIKLTDKEYAEDVVSGGLHKSSTSLEKTYKDMVEKATNVGMVQAGKDVANSAEYKALHAADTKLRSGAENVAKRFGVDVDKLLAGDKATLDAIQAKVKAGDLPHLQSHRVNVQERAKAFQAFEKIRQDMPTGEVIKLANSAHASTLFSEANASLKEYKKLVKAGKYSEAQEALKTARNTLDTVAKRFNIDVKVPEVTVGTNKSRAVKTKRNYEKLLKEHELKVDEAKRKLDEIHATGPRDYQKDIDNIEARRIQHTQETKENLRVIEDIRNEAVQFKKQLQPPDVSEYVNQRKALLSIKQALEDVRNFPTTAKEFISMGTKSTNNLMDSLQVVFKAQELMPELAPVIDSLEKATQSLVESTGIKAEGGIIEQLKAIQKIAKEANKQSILGPIEHEVLNAGKQKSGRAHTNILSDGAAMVGASKFARMSGTGTPGYLMAKHALLGGVEGLAGIKNAVQEKISKAAKAVGKTLQRPGKNYVVPKLEPLYTKLDGSRDKESKNASDAATARIHELVQMTPVVNDVLYKGIEPYATGVHSNVFAAMHKAAVDAHSALIEDLPKDRLGTVSGMRPTWKANQYETVLTAKLLRAFYSPIDVMTDALNGKLDPIELKGVQKYHPELHQFMVMHVVEQIANNPDLVKTFNQQQAYYTLTGVVTNSAFKPENTVDAQAIFVATPDVSQANQGGGNRNNSGGGRSPKMEPPTTAQSLTRM